MERELIYALEYKTYSFKKYERELHNIYKKHHCQ